ncbi:MAG: DUF2520 domain-containing protein [Thermoguttaceae bacterium]|nr:DUF2520 domain-containing protein [Thermoguttaceae bacterium]MDW8038567.1 DUF2520 domain-containing protein [Thermoguttaceae bacterium]
MTSGLPRVPKLNIIGCGRVGRALARLWLRHGLVEIGGILNRSLASSQAAAAFVGGGCPVEEYHQLPAAELVMISAADEAIGDCVSAWTAAHRQVAEVIVFHCSGALGAEILLPAKQQGAWIASVHPVKSFADPAMAAESFPGTWCGLEGDPEAVKRLREILQACGARCFIIPPQQKPLYHAGAVFACNYLVALMKIAYDCLEQAGLSAAEAPLLLQPIVEETVKNVFRLGPVRALTGPIARGEATVVKQEIAALEAWKPEYGQLYRCLGQVALQLARSAAHASPEALQKIATLLARMSGKATAEE